MPNKKNGLGIMRLPNPFICNVLLVSANIQKESKLNIMYSSFTSARRERYHRFLNVTIL